MTRGNLTSWYVYEAIGTTRQLTNVQSQVTDSYAFDAWGNELGAQGSTVNPHRYVGKHGYYLDTQSALMLLGVRYYVTNIGRFISLDPVMQGMNWYQYVFENPLKEIDPMGLWCIKIPDWIPFIGGKCIGNTCDQRPDCPQYKPKPAPPPAPPRPSPPALPSSLPTSSFPRIEPPKCRHNCPNWPFCKHEMPDMVPDYCAKYTYDRYSCTSCCVDQLLECIRRGYGDYCKWLSSECNDTCLRKRPFPLRQNYEL